MKLLLAFTPFHTPASPPFGLACLKGALTRSRPEVTVRTVDWNLAFFRRWLQGEMPDLCDHHPTHLLGTVCPSLIVDSRLGDRLLADLTHLPQTPAEQDRYVQAARILDDLYNRLAAFYHDILFPVVEGRQTLSSQAADDLFGAELAQIAAEQPDMVGFSILTEHNLLYTLALGQLVKERLGIPVVLGGAMMSHLEPEELLCSYPWLDIVFFGEAENSLAQFVDIWPGGNLSQVGGIAYREGDRVRCQPQPAHAQVDLAQLPPPDFGDFPLEKYVVPEPVLPIITSRGCYWGKCTFCSHTLPYGGGARVRRPEQVVAEMAEQMARYGVRRFLFVDEAISPRMLRALSREIRSRGLDVQFGAEGVRVEAAFDEALLREAYDAGLRWVYVGVESAHQRLLDLIEKGITVEGVETFIAACRRAGITPQLSFIVGLPGTTREELDGEIAFMKRHPMDSSSFVLLLGAPMQQQPERYGIRVEEQQVLYRTPQGVVHAPRFYFSAPTGLSPVVADAIVEAAGPYRKMRPHLGEVHALLLAGTDFFHSEARPPAPMGGAEIAGQALARRQASGQVDGRWFLHALGCLEDQGRLEETVTLAQAGLKTTRDPHLQAALMLHLAAAQNMAGRPEAVVRLLGKNGTLTEPALHAERARARFTLGRARPALRDLNAMFKGGHEIRWAYYIQGLCYEETGRPQQALAALARAEERDWLEPDVNEARARCWQQLAQPEQQQEEIARARRKRVSLGEP